MKSILIDPFAKTVTEVEHDGTLDAIYAAIGADCVCTVRLDEEGDAVFLDDDGLFKRGQEFFAIGNYPHPLAGKGLVLGCDAEGESVAPTCTLAQVAGAVHWLTPQEAVQMNREAALAMETHAAIENAKAGEGAPFHVIHAPLMDIDAETGKARA